MILIPITEGLNSFRKIGKYELSNICLKSYPCKHYVKFENGDTNLLSGDILYRLFKSEGLSDPHIDAYAEWVRQQDFPTPTEIIKRNYEQEQIQSSMEKRKKEEDERQKIIEQYKASSRLDKLKNKNNIYYTC